MGHGLALQINWVREVTRDASLENMNEIAATMLGEEVRAIPRDMRDRLCGFRRPRKRGLASLPRPSTVLLAESIKEDLQNDTLQVVVERYFTQNSKGNRRSRRKQHLRLDRLEFFELLPPDLIKKIRDALPAIGVSTNFVNLAESIKEDLQNDTLQAVVKRYFSLNSKGNPRRPSKQHLRLDRLEFFDLLPPDLLEEIRDALPAIGVSTNFVNLAESIKEDLQNDTLQAVVKRYFSLNSKGNPRYPIKQHLRLDRLEFLELLPPDLLEEIRDALPPIGVRTNYVDLAESIEEDLQHDTLPVVVKRYFTKDWKGYLLIPSGQHLRLTRLEAGNLLPQAVIAQIRDALPPRVTFDGVPKGQYREDLMKQRAEEFRKKQESKKRKHR